VILPKAKQSANFAGFAKLVLRPLREMHSSSTDALSINRKCVVLTIYNRLTLDQLFVLDSMGLIIAQTFFLVLLILTEAPFKPIHLGISFKRKYVSTNPIEEPTVV
jgi:hypothetical protein